MFPEAWLSPLRLFWKGKLHFQVPELLTGTNGESINCGSFKLVNTLSLSRETQFLCVQFSNSICEFIEC